MATSKRIKATIVISTTLLIIFVFVGAYHHTTSENDVSHRPNDIESTDKISHHEFDVKTKLLYLSQDFDHSNKNSKDYILDNFSEADLAIFYDILIKENFVRHWLYVLEVICILETDKEKAFQTITNFLYRKENWNKINNEKSNVSIIATNKFLSISRIGFIGTEEANAFLIEHLAQDKAEKLVKANKFPGVYGLSLEESITWVQTGAAYGLLFANDDEAFQHVEETFYRFYDENEGGGLLSYRFITNLKTIIGYHRFYEEKGYEEGRNILNQLTSDEKAVLIMEYEPAFPGMEEEE